MMARQSIKQFADTEDPAVREFERGLIPNPLLAPVPRDAIARGALIVGVLPYWDGTDKVRPDPNPENTCKPGQAG